jgi:hypothetical protein
MEQKVRDDHDSTKKRGQIENFRKKLTYLRSIHGDALIGIMYFIDPSLHKNEGYYQQEIKTLQKELGIPIYLFYNGEVFQFLQGHTRTWDLLLGSLQDWRKSVPEQITLDYDANPEKTLVELSSVSGSIWYKLITNDALWESGVITTLFPNGAALQKLEATFREQGGTRIRAGRNVITSNQFAAIIRLKLNKYYAS